MRYIQILTMIVVLETYMLSKLFKMAGTDSGLTWWLQMYKLPPLVELPKRLIFRLETEVVHAEENSVDIFTDFVF